MEVYESFVKEYLEYVEGFNVRVDLRFRKNNGWSDLDILGIKVTDEKPRIIIGEVKAWTLSENQILKELEDFENPNLLDAIKNMCGSGDYERWIFCWSMTDTNIEFARSKGINVKQFYEMINEIFEIVDRERSKGLYIYQKDYPNLTLIQMMYFFLKVNRIQVSGNILSEREPSRPIVRNRRIRRQ